MHSLAMAENIFKAALNEAGNHKGSRIKSINIRIAEENFTESDSLRFCLEEMARGTIAEGANVKIELVGMEESSLVTLELD
ncbi:hydrogenase/urease maturation nickel metallochaperone HypA [Chloroflexota bacterium]